MEQQDEGETPTAEAHLEQERLRLLNARHLKKNLKGDLLEAQQKQLDAKKVRRAAR